MSQPATWGIPLESAEPTVTPEAFAIRADDSVDALLSSHSGTTRPTYAVQGTLWHDTDLLTTTPLLMYDGTVDRIVLVEDASGNIDISGDYVATTATTVAALPTSPAPITGARAFVTDANATTFASVVAAGGANGVPVYFDGTDWRIG